MRFAVIVLVSLWSLPSLADENRELAKQHFTEAEKAFAVENYRFAAEEYEASYKLFPSPALLWNLGQAYRQFDEKKALHYYRLYLDTAKPGTKAGRFLHDAEERVRELEPVVATQEKAKAAPPDGVVSHSDAEREAPAAEGTGPRATPAPTLSNSNPIAEPQTVPVALTAPAPARDWYRTPLAIVGFSLLGVGVAATGIAVGLLVHSNDLDHQLANTTSIPQAESITNARDSYRSGSYATFAIGGAAAVLGAVLVGIGASRGRSHRVAFSATPAISGGIVLTVGGSL